MSKSRNPDKTQAAMKFENILFFKVLGAAYG